MWELGKFSKFITFGSYDRLDAEYTKSDGWIYTKGDQVEWLYEGQFYGGLGYITQVTSMCHFIGIKNFYGVCLGGWITVMLHLSLYFGYAKEVKITTEKP